VDEYVKAYTEAFGEEFKLDESVFFEIREAFFYAVQLSETHIE